MNRLSIDSIQIGGYPANGTRVDAIEIAGVTKAFRTVSGSVLALDELNLTVPDNGVFGLVGPNGAGKSTLLRLICGLVRADKGSVRILSQVATPRIRRCIGALIDAPLFYPFLTGQEVLQTLAYTSGVKVSPSRFLENVGLAHAANRPVSGYSLGMRQRLGVAAALLNDPHVVVLDEPTNGLDPDGIIQIRQLVRNLADDEGRTVILTSHILDEVQRICDRVAILKAGRVVAEKSLGDFRHGERLWLEVRQVDTALALIGSQAALEANGIMVTLDRAGAPELIRRLSVAGVDIYEARWLRPSLEDLFLTKTRETL